MNKPSIDEICKKVDSRYTLVVESAKRARELISGAQPLIDPKDRKPVSVAVEEINRGLLIYHRNLEDEDN
ncbi:MAG: DNA-directed RNA polymerase subunit omega [Clostridia bacterium]|nr:DNA-directed RNA polymerase subunit omega [Clostridia bacterium]